MRRSVWVLSAAVPLVMMCSGFGLMQPEGQPQRRVQTHRPERRAGGGPEQFIDRLMQGDANGDGKLSKEEMEAGPGARIFDRADTNQDGFVDRAELNAFFTQRFQDRPRPGEAAEAGGNFRQSMQQTGRAFRRLQRSELNEASRASDLDQLQAIEQGLISAKGSYSTVEMSEAAHAKFGDDADAYHKAFREAILNVLKETLAVESAVLDGDHRAASKAMERVIELQGRAHDLFQPEEEEDGQGG